MHQNTPYLDFVCKSHKGSKFVLVDDPKPTLDPDIKVVDILKNQIVLIVQEFRALVLGGDVHFNTIYHRGYTAGIGL